MTLVELYTTDTNGKEQYEDLFTFPTIKKLIAEHRRLYGLPNEISREWVLDASVDELNSKMRGAHLTVVA